MCFHAQIASSTQAPPSLRIYAHLPFVSIMADWMNEMANAVEEAEAANARAQEEVPTEPAISPRDPVLEVPINDGRWTSNEYAQILWYVAHDLNARDQAILHQLLEKQQVEFRAQTKHDMENATQQAQAAEHEAHERSIREWDAQIQARGLDAPALPSGPPPQGISSQRVLPRVHEALRQNDPSVTSHSQPAVKKAPPTCGRPMPSVFYSDTEPPRIGSGVQPPPPAAPRPKVVPSIALPLAETPMTPLQVIHLVLHCQHFQSILLWRRAHVPISMHWIHRQRKLHRASKFDARHFQSLLNLQKRSMWQHQHQLRCLNRADHVQKVLQLHSYLHPQRLRPCRQTPTRRIGKLD